MTLQIHRSDRADALVRGLGELLADVPADPFTPEVVAVPSKGVERWITQTLVGLARAPAPATASAPTSRSRPRPGWSPRR